MLYLFPALLVANTLACASAEPAPTTEAAAQPAPQVTPAAAPQSPAPTPTPVPAANLPVEARFAAWKQRTLSDLSRRYSAEAAQSVLGPAQFRPALLESDSNQPEFTRPIWGYLDSAVAESRVRPGRDNLAAFGALFDRIEARYNVPREVVAAIWGLESQYGTNMGDNPVVDALATLAFEGRREALFTTQIEALVDLVNRGRLDAGDLRGSWAGAIGMTQFLPATLRDYGVDFDGDGRIDLRGSEADALASAAHYLARFGWQPGQPTYVEVRLPTGFDFALADNATARPARVWRELGAVPVDGELPASALEADAKLYLPAGARGPAFLLFPNFDVIKRYNPSTSYALGIAGLAKAFRGEVPVVQDFPRDDQPLSFSDKRALQQRLQDLGFDPGGVDGIVGPGTRRAVRAWQGANGLPADGYVEQTLFRRIMGA